MRTKLASLVAVAALIAVAGCATFTVAPGARPEVVYAEYSAEQALAVFDSFLKWERENEAVLKALDPQIHRTANDIRDNGMKWIGELREATKAYKAKPASDTLTALQIAQQFLDLAISELRAATAKGASI